MEEISEHGELELALQVLSLAKEKGMIIPPRFIFHLVKTLARKKKAEESKLLLLEMISRGCLLGNEVFNLDVYACSTSGDPDGSREILKQIVIISLVPDVYSYTMAISGYARRGVLNRAQELLVEAKQKHENLCPVTYEALIQGFFKSEQYDDVLKLFEERDLFG